MKKRILAIILCLLLVVSGTVACTNLGDLGNENNSSNNGSSSGNGGSSSSGEAVNVDFSKTDEDMFTKRDKDTSIDEASAITIELNGTSASASDASVKIEGSKVTITKEATYIVKGRLSDGMLMVDAPEEAKLQVVLQNVNISSGSSAALYVKAADKVFITLVGENTLTNGGSFVAIDDNNIDGTLYSKEDISFNGEGSLSISSPAGHGIVGKDDVVFTGGNISITSSGHGMDANDSVRMQNAVFTIDAGKDGIHVENTEDTEKGFVYISGGSLDIECEGDGISAGAYVQICDGIIDILAGGGYENGTKENSGGWGDFGGGGFPGGNRPDGGGRPGGRSTSEATVNGETNTHRMGNLGSTESTSTEDSSTSMKGIKAQSGFLIAGGTFTIDSADDALHSNTSLVINGGSFKIASGDDAVHAEESLNITAGTFDITHSYEGLEALHITVSGGDIKIVSSDDGLNAAGGTDQSGTGGRDEIFGGKPGMGGGMSTNSNGSIVISGGTLYINASGDGIDANGTLEITGGLTTVCGPTQGDTAVLDYDKTASITGGSFIGTGSSMMAQSFSENGQGVIALSVGSQSAGTAITLKDASGNVIIDYTPQEDFQIVILTTPEMKSGESYSITVGSASGEFEAN